MSNHGICWLLSEADRALAARALLGDEIALGDGADADWFAPAGVGAVSGGRILMLSYEGAGGRRKFCVPAGGRTVESVRLLREQVSQDRADALWGPFANHVGVRPAPPVCVDFPAERVPWSGGMARVRRPHHANFLLDRLMLREREIAIETLCATQV